MTRARIVERAIVFIAEARARHSTRLGLEVGEHLFVHLYASDEARVFCKDPTREDSLRDIEKATAIGVHTLSRWIKAAIVARRLVSMGMDPEIGLVRLAALYPIREKDALMALIEWSRHMKSGDVVSFVSDLAEHLAAGGTLESFNKRTRNDPRRKHRRRPRPRNRRADALIVSRLVTLLTDWATDAHLTVAQRRALVARLRAIRARLT